MQLPKAIKKLERRQAHLLRRIATSAKPLSHDVQESAAISCVLMEIRKHEDLKGK